MAAYDRYGTKSLVAGGALAGLIGGLAMAMVAMIRAGVEGLGFWLPPRLIGATFVGIDALTSGAGVVILGLITHMAVSMGFGILFAALIRRSTTTGTAVLGGVLMGIAAWAVMTFVALPLLNDIMRERSYALAPGWWFAYHLVFGAFLGLTPAFCQRFSSRYEEPSGRREEPRRLRRAA